jgi:hypothetical protein
MELFSRSWVSNHKATPRIVGATANQQLEIVRLWKRQIIKALSPKCSNCTLPMRIIDNGKLWFCPLGCESREVK